jgi:hypothetical protein
MMESVPIGWRLKRQKYNLIGTRCATCSSLFFPPRNFCPRCRRKGRIVDFQFSGKGEIVSYTVIRTAPKGFEKYTPYTVALIKLDEGPTISGQVVSNGMEVSIGKRVSPVFRRMYEDSPDGQIHYGVKFEITG